MNENGKVTVIIVTYNSSSIVCDAISSIIDDPNISECIIVDNASSDDTINVIRKKFATLSIVENDKNLGFGAANNIALEMVKTDYALLLNPDAVLRNNALSELIPAAEKYLDAAIIAPISINEDGTIQKNYKQNIFKRERQEKICDFIPEGDFCIDYIAAAVWFLNMSNLRQIGFFDPNIFLFYEDDDLCMRVRKAGYSVIMIPSAKAKHALGKSSPPSNEILEFKQKHIVLSRLYIEEKYCGKEAAKMLAIKKLYFYIFKSFLYIISFNFKKMRRYKARMAGLRSYLLGKKIT